MANAPKIITITLSKKNIEKLEEKLKRDQEGELRKIARLAKANNALERATLEKDFADRRIQPKAKLPSIGKKTGYSPGYIGEYKYDDNTRATFAIKSALNRSINNEAHANGLQTYKTPSSSRGDIGDFIREYIAGPLYRLALQEAAPLIELVEPNKDENIRDENIYLRSKFLPKFETFMALKAKNDSLQNVAGLEKIMAISLILGEEDLHTENFGVIEKNEKRIFAKIDHGRTFCNLPSSLDYFSEIIFSSLAEENHPPSLVKLQQELERGYKFFADNKELINNIIEQRVYNLEKMLSLGISFIMQAESFSGTDSGIETRKMPIEEIFTFKKAPGQAQSHLISDHGHLLGDYFKNVIEASLINTPKEFSTERLKITAQDLKLLAETRLNEISEARKDSHSNREELASAQITYERMLKDCKQLIMEPQAPTETAEQKQRYATALSEYNQARTEAPENYVSKRYISLSLAPGAKSQKLPDSPAEAYVPYRNTENYRGSRENNPNSRER